MTTMRNGVVLTLERPSTSMNLAVCIRREVKEKNVHIDFLLNADLLGSAVAEYDEWVKIGDFSGALKVRLYLDSLTPKGRDSGKVQKKEVPNE